MIAIPEGVAEIERWVSARSGAGLVLPDGWFGRPYDNRHKVTLVLQRGDRWLIELDERILLVLDGPTTVIAAESELTLTGFQKCVVDWREAGEREVHISVFEGGEVRLVAFR
jgi:hypothetical protein